MARSARLPQEALDQSTMLEREARDYFLEASEQTSNELAMRTFQAVAEQHSEHARQVEAMLRSVRINERPEVRGAGPVRSMFDGIMRTVEHSAAPSAADIAQLRRSLAYSAKVRDVYDYLLETTEQDWERRLYSLLKSEETALRMTLSDTLNYLRSNFELSDLPKQD